MISTRPLQWPCTTYTDVPFDNVSLGSHRLRKKAFLLRTLAKGQWLLYINWAAQCCTFSSSIMSCLSQGDHAEGAN